MAAVTICSDFGAQKNKVWHCFHCFSICYEMMGLGAMIFVFWMLSFKPTFSLSSLTFIKRLFSSSSLSATRVVSSAYLRLLIFLPAILIPGWASSSPEFLMLYKQGDDIQPWCIPFPIWNQSVFPCPVLTVASWPAYRFLKKQVRWSVSEFSTVYWDPHSQRLVIVNKTEIDVLSVPPNVLCSREKYYSYHRKEDVELITEACW